MPDSNCMTLLIMARVSVSSAIFASRSDLHLLHHLFKMSVSSLHLRLNKVGAFFEIASDITHETTPVCTVGLDRA